MKLNPCSIFIASLLASIAASNAQIVRTATADNLNLGAAWTGGTAPTGASVATWDASSTLTNTLGGNLTWGGLNVSAASGAVSISGTNTLSAGAVNVGANALSITTSTANNSLNFSSLTGTGNLTISNGAANLGITALNTANALNFNGTLTLRGGNASTAPATLASHFFYLGRSGITQAAGTAFALDTGASTTNAKDVIIDGDAWNGKTINLTSLTGFGTLRSDSGAAGTRSIRIDQATDTTFSGLILSHTSTGAAVRKVSVEKAGAGSLTLAGIIGKQTASAGAAAADVDLNVSGGTLILTAANTRTGATTIASGATLQAGNGGGSGLIGGSGVTVNGSLVFDYASGAAITSANTFTGAGPMSKKGLGSIAFTGNSSAFTGNIDLVAGSIRMGPSLGTGVMTVRDGAFFAAGLAATAGTSQAGSLVLEDNTESDFRIGTINDQITLSGTLTAPPAGPHTVNILGTPVSGGTIKLIDYTGTALGTTEFDRFVLGTVPSGAATFQLVNNTVDTSIDLLITLEDQIWKGSTDGNWDSFTTNWVMETATGTPVAFNYSNPSVFNDTAAIFAVTVDAAGVSPTKVTFNNSANDYTISGGAINGVGALLKSGSATTTLAQANTYSGGTTINGGTLRIGNGGTTGDIGGGAVTVAAGSSLEFNRSNTTPGTADLDYKTNAKLRNVSGAGSIALTGGGILFNYTGSGIGFAETGSWAGFSGNLTVKGGSEFMTIRNGATAMGSGDVILGDATTSGSLSQTEGSWTWTNDIQLVGSANHVINRSGTISGGRSLKLQGVISGSGGLTFSDPSASMNNTNSGFVLTGANTCSGTLNIPTGVPVRVGGVPGDVSVSAPGLNADNSGSLGTASIVNDGTLTFSRKDAHSVGNAISGTGSVRVGIPAAASLGDTTTQVVTYTGTATYAGATTVNNGTLVIGAGASVGGSGVSVVAGSTLSGTGTVSAPVTAAGTIAPGPGTGVLTTGNTVLTGTYACDISGASSDKLATGTLDITGATLTLNGTPTAASYTIATYTGTLAGTFTFTPPSGYALDYTTAGEIKLVQSGSEFDNWILGFYPGETNAAIIGIDADPDNDGIDNGLEFVLKGGNPAVSGGAQLPTGTRSGANFVFTFEREDRAKGANAGVTLSVEAGTSLAAWPSVFSVAADTASSTTGVVITNDGDANPDTVTVTIPTAGAPALFARLKAVETP